MQAQQWKRLAIAAMVGLGVSASSLGGFSAMPAAAQGGATRLPSSGPTFTAQPVPTPPPAQLNLDWFCHQPSPAHNLQFCTDYKNNQPHPDYP